MKLIMMRIFVIGVLVAALIGGLAMVSIGLCGVGARLSEGIAEAGKGWCPPSTPTLVMDHSTQLNPAPASEAGAPFHPLATISETLQALSDAVIPESDLQRLAQELEGKTVSPATLPSPAGPLLESARKNFWVSNSDENTYFQVTAVLAAISDHAYLWMQEGIRYKAEDAKQLVETFESHIYPTNRAFFGSEWTPGVDSDPHLYILFARGIGAGVLGAFSSMDEYPPQVRRFSNGHEMFVLNADKLGVSSPSALGTLAHEFQHMIHWYRDRNEETWLNEGAAELAAFLNGYDRNQADVLYTRAPDLQLNDWPDYTSQNVPHYRAALLFLAYFLDRFGEQATQALVAHPANGLESIDEVLKALGVPDGASGGQLTADDVFQDWSIANFLQDVTFAGGRYGYQRYPLQSRPKPVQVIRKCPTEPLTGDVHQYGVDYIEIACRGEFQLSFEGFTQVKLLPVDPYSGQYAFWSNQSDESDTTLTRIFDFSGQSAPLTLAYQAWFDLEEDYDYVYLEVSLDGKNWQILKTPRGTAEDPIGNNYGWGYTGASQGWIKEEVDLSAYAGRKVSLRFQYITDKAIHGEGFILDDLAIPEIGYMADFEAGASGWEAAGWVRLRNILPQTYRLTLVKRAGHRTTAVDDISLDDANSALVPMSLPREIEQAILVISGTTRYTHQKAAYRFTILNATPGP
jgi:immune inhibitor A